MNKTTKPNNYTLDYETALHFEYINIADTNTGWTDNAGKDYGYVDGLVRGFNVEFKHKETGKVIYNSCIWEEGNIEDYFRRQIDAWGHLGFVLFEAERSKGYEPTGRAVFRGYGKVEYAPEERDSVVKRINIEKWLHVAELIPNNEIDRHSSIYKNTHKELADVLFQQEQEERIELRR